MVKGVSTSGQGGFFAHELVMCTPWGPFDPRPQGPPDHGTPLCTKLIYTVTALVRIRAYSQLEEPFKNLVCLNRIQDLRPTLHIPSHFPLNPQQNRTAHLGVIACGVRESVLTHPC